MKKLIIASISLALFSPLNAQELGIGELVNNALKAMKQGNWEEAAKLSTEATTRFGEDPERARKRYGSEFGVIWYRKGIAEMQLKQFDKAMASFESCYKDYPNDSDSKKKGNLFDKKALLKWGEAALSAQQYPLAIEKWQKFLEERKRRDRYERGPFFTNMAIAHYRMGKFKEGNENFEIAIKNKNTFPTPNLAIASGFQAIAQAAIEKGEEQMLLDFIAKNRGALAIPAPEMHRFSNIFLKLGADAISAKMLDAALVLYQFVPSTSVALNDLEGTLAAIGSNNTMPDGSVTIRRPMLEEQIKRIKDDPKGAKKIEEIKLAAVAYIYEAKGFIRGAQANYLQLEKFHKQADGREKNLFQLIRLSSSLGEIDKVLEYGPILKDLYPDSKFAPDVSKLMLTSLFYDGAYERAIIVAQELIDGGTVLEGSPMHDMALFVKGGSLYYTAAYEEAAPVLEKHTKLYQASPYIMTTEYFAAGNAGRLRLWKKAAKLLSAFLEKYKDNTDEPYYALALFDYANAYYNLDDPEKARELLERLIKEFPENSTISQAHLLIGNILETDLDFKGAEKAYIKALKIAEQRENRATAGESLYNLVRLLADLKDGNDPSPRVKEAIPYADKYWEKYAAGSPYQAQLAVAQFPALNSVGRDQEALKRLQTVISEMAKKKGTAGLEEAINSYTEAYLEKHSPQQLKEHYYNFPDIGTQDKAARALLNIAVIGVFEKIAKKTQDADEKRSTQAMIKVLFQNLKTDFDLDELTSLILIELGDYLRENTSTPREALPYYDKVLERNEQEHRFSALLGRADVFGLSKSTDDKARAIQDFDIVFTDSKKKKEREFALYRIIYLLMEKKDYKEAARRANQYLTREKDKALNFGTYRAQVSLLLARSFAKRKMFEDAILMHSKIWISHMGFIEISAPSIYEYMELLWNRNRPENPNKPDEPSDRQGAYNAGFEYLERTKKLQDLMSAADLKLWKKIEDRVTQYVADPAVKSNAQLKKEQENR